jgi:hypothetical protein
MEIDSPQSNNSSSISNSHQSIESVLLTPDFHHDNLLKNVKSIRQTGYRINTWRRIYDLATLGDQLVKKRAKFDLMHQAKLIDYDAIENDIKHLASKDLPNFVKFQEEQRDPRFPRTMLYRIWEHMFLKPGYNQNELLENLTAREKTEMDVKRKYLTILTDQILNIYRHSIVIDESFVFKCFEHDLEKVLLMLLRIHHLYNVKLEKGTLFDLYFVYACDLGKNKILVKLLPETNIHHLEYALRYTSYETIRLIYEHRRCIPSFDANMTILRSIVQNWKTNKIFERWQRDAH